MVVTSNGKPVGILSAATENTVEESLNAVGRARATLAVMKIQMESVKKGTDKMTLDEINREIAGFVIGNCATMNQADKRLIH